MSDDAKLHAVLVVVKGHVGGWSTVQDHHEVLESLKRSGKTTAVHFNHMGNEELVVASAADKVWVYPPTEVFLSGLGSRLSFLGTALRRMGIEVELEMAGSYKSAGEPLTRAFASPQSRLQLEALFTDLREQMIHDLERGRGVSEEALNEAMASSPMPAQKAEVMGLIDGAVYADQIEDALAKELAVSDVKLVPFARYRRWRRLEQWLSAVGSRRKKIAVVHLSGPVVMGDDTLQTQRISASDVVRTLDDLADADGVSAVILRVTSPGGSAVASDLIARSVRRLGCCKPVVASYGSVSASGGYYLSVPAKEIVARRGCITGSIGVIGGKVVVSEALARHGMTADYVEAGQDVGFLGPFRLFTPSQRQRFRAYLNRTYATFLNVVSAGRGAPLTDIEPLAGGRVWTGRQAHENGLIDHLGGLHTAVERVHDILGVCAETTRLVHIEFSPSRFRLIRGALSGSGSAADLAWLMGGRHAESVRLFADHPAQALALLPISFTGE